MKIQQISIIAMRPKVENERRESAILKGWGRIGEGDRRTRQGWRAGVSSSWKEFLLFCLS